MLWVAKHFYPVLYFWVFRGHNSLCYLKLPVEFFFNVCFYLGAWGFGFFIVILWLRGFPSFCSHRRSRLLLLLLLLICNNPPNTHDNRLLGLLLFVLLPTSPSFLLNINLHKPAICAHRQGVGEKEGKGGGGSHKTWFETRPIGSKATPRRRLFQLRH